MIIVGLALFTVFGQPAEGNGNAPFADWLFVIVLVAIVSGTMLAFAGRGGLSMRAALYGSAAGVLFGLSASLTKPTLGYLQDGVGEMLSHWEPYVLAIVGLALALGGAVVISMATEGAKGKLVSPEPEPEPAPAL